MEKVLFLIHDLGPGGAEKVLVNLVNNMDYSKFEVTVMTLFDWGENRQFLKPQVRYKSWCSKMIPGNSHLMKMLSPEKLHRLIIKEHYDIEVAYLEGPCARVISGCKDISTKLVAWIHGEHFTTTSFRSRREAEICYSKFKKIICVSEGVRSAFYKSLNIKTPYQILYNTNESEKIVELSKGTTEEISFSKEEIKLIGVGKLQKNKGFDRILRITNRLLKEGYKIHTYILGEGSERENLQRYIDENNLNHQISLLGYQLNPYKYTAKCDLFVCASHAEGFSTAATEALILGIPVCTVEVSGMKEMLGENNEYGIVVKNDEDSLYNGIKQLLDNRISLSHFKHQAEIRGKDFNTAATVAKVEKMLCEI